MEGTKWCALKGKQFVNILSYSEFTQIYDAINKNIIGFICLST